MRVEYINPFSEAAYNILVQVLGGEVKRGDLYLKSTCMPVMGVAAIVGLAGDVEGRVIFDMTAETALKIASTMNQEEFTEFDLGFKFDLTPPALFTGDNMSISSSDIEALIVPMEMAQGKVEINVAIRDRA